MPGRLRAEQCRWMVLRPYLALCKKGLKGHAPSLIKAIQIMLEVQPVIDDGDAKQRQKREELVATLEKLGVNADGLRKRYDL